MSQMTPREIVSELRPLHRSPAQRQAGGSHRPCAIAGAASRWPDDLREEIAPKNIIMIGPTGSG